MTTIKNKIGIVVLNYNSYNLTVTLANKLSSFNSVDAICVVDNCSKDNFEGVFTHDKIHYIKNHVNSGYSAGNNVGLRYLIEEKNCDYVFIANPDTIFEENVIEDIRDTFNKNPDIALISTKRFGHEGATIHQYFDFPDWKASVRSCFFLTRRKFEKSRHIDQNKKIDEANGIVYVDAVPGAFFGLRSEFLVRNNYLYEGIFLFGEEIIVGHQAHDLGYKAAIINTCTYIHDHKQQRFNNRKMFWRDRKSLKVYYRMFCNLTKIEWLMLNIAIILGTCEYNCEYFLFNALKKIRK